MRYFLVISAVLDGEYEYWHYVPVCAVDEESAQARGLAANQSWVSDDYRIVSCEGITEIPQEDFEVLRRYLKGEL